MKKLSVRDTIYQILLLAKEPLTFPEIMKSFEKNDRVLVGSRLWKMYDAGLINRSGQHRHYAYFLTTDTRQRLTTEGALNYRARPRKPANRVAPVMRTASARQADWPAPNPTIQLAPALGLPWTDEDELPPVIGERYADVMHRIGLE